MTLSPGIAISPVLDALAVLRAEPEPGAVRRVQHERQPHLAVGHVAGLRDLVDDHVPGHREEVAEHQLGDGAQAGHRRAHRRADDRLLADRRVDDPARAEPVEQALGQLEHAAGRADVLAEQHDVRVALHLPGDALPRGRRGRSVPPRRSPRPPRPGSRARRRSAPAPLARLLPRPRRPWRGSPRRSRRAAASVTPRAVSARPVARDRVLGQPRLDLVVRPVLARDRRASGRRGGRSAPR